MLAVNGCVDLILGFFFTFDYFIFVPNKQWAKIKNSTPGRPRLVDRTVQLLTDREVVRPPPSSLRISKQLRRSSTFQRLQLQCLLLLVTELRLYMYIHICNIDNFVEYQIRHSVFYEIINFLL